MTTTGNGTYRCHTQGQCADESLEYIEFTNGKHSCGDIENGVAIRLGGMRGVFVVDKADLLKALEGMQ